MLFRSAQRLGLEAHASDLNPVAVVRNGTPAGTRVCNVATVSLATLDEAIKKEEAKATSQDITLEAIVAYMQVLRNQLLIDLARINERTTLEQLDLEKKRVEKGGGVAVDELQAATRLQIVRERRVFYEQSMRDAAAAYEQVYGKKPDFIGLEDLDSYTKLLPADVDALERVGLDIAGHEVEHLGRVAPELGIGGEEAEVGVDARGDRVVIAGAEMHIGADRRPFPAHHHAQLG